MTKPLRGWGAFFAAILNAVGVSGCQPSGNTLGAKAPPVNLPLPSPDEKGVYRVTSDDLYLSFHTDRKATDRLLKGKTLIVSGHVVVRYSDVEVNKERAAKGGPTNPDLFFHVNSAGPLDMMSSANGVICNFPDAARPELRKLVKTLKYEDVVSVRGSLNSYMLGSIWLENCTLEGVDHATGESPPLPVPSATPKGKRAK